ncbi:MAG: RNA methyltransferase, partial [Desulfuromonas sp.]
MDSPFEMFAIVAPGLEPECSTELETLDVSGITPQRGGVSFHGDRARLQQANLLLRSASRVLVRVGA